MNQPTLQDLLAADKLPEMRWMNRVGEWQVLPSWAVDTRYGRLEGPAGFMSDGMSDPIGRSWGAQGWPAVVHDLVYRLRPDGWTQAMADQVFLDLMLEFKVAPWRARIRWAVLRVAGWVAWTRNGKNVKALRARYDYDCTKIR